MSGQVVQRHEQPRSMRRIDTRGLTPLFPDPIRDAVIEHLVATELLTLSEVLAFQERLRSGHRFGASDWAVPEACLGLDRDTLLNTYRSIPLEWTVEIAELIVGKIPDTLVNYRTHVGSEMFGRGTNLIIDNCPVATGIVAYAGDRPHAGFCEAARQLGLRMIFLGHYRRMLHLGVLQHLPGSRLTNDLSAQFTGALSRHLIRRIPIRDDRHRILTVPALPSREQPLRPVYRVRFENVVYTLPLHTYAFTGRGV